MAGKLGRTRPFADVPADALQSISVVDRVRVKAGATLMEPGEGTLYYWLVLDGECRADRVEPDGSLQHCGNGAERAKHSVRLRFLSGKTHSMFLVTAARDSELLRFTAEQFWALMACCPEARKVVLADMAVAAADVPGRGIAPGKAGVAGNAGSGPDA